MTIMLEVINGNYLIDKEITLTNKDKIKIKEILKKVNKRVLYDSKIHGYYHSKRVFLFSYLIAKHEKLNEIDFQIITDAALYHDIGRINDYEDSLHGYCGVLKIDKIVTHPIYREQANLNILKAIIDGHSVDDKHKDYFIGFYEIVDINRYYKLYKILKDADALDRKRLGDDLDESFLRLNISKRLVALAEKINNIYKNKIFGTHHWQVLRKMLKYFIVTR